MPQTQEEVNTNLQGQIDELTKKLQGLNLPTTPEIPKFQDITFLSNLKVDSAVHKSAVFTSEVNNGNSGTSLLIDWSQGNKQKIITTGSCTLTFVNPMGKCNLILRMVHEASTTPYTYTYPANVKWSGGTKPTTTNTSGAVDIIVFYFDGTNYWGTGSLNFS